MNPININCPILEFCFILFLLAAFRHVKQLKDFVIFLQNYKLLSESWMPILEANSKVERKQQFWVVGELCLYIILTQQELTRGNEPNQHNAHSQL